MVVDIHCILYTAPTCYLLQVHRHRIPFTPDLAEKLNKLSELQVLANEPNSYIEHLTHLTHGVPLTSYLLTCRGCRHIHLSTY